MIPGLSLTSCTAPSGSTKRAGCHLHTGQGSSSPLLSEDACACSPSSSHWASLSSPLPPAPHPQQLLGLRQASTLQAQTGPAALPSLLDDAWPQQSTPCGFLLP